MKPIVTIALPVFNGAETLPMAVESILAQSFTDWELIILDDASTDNTADVMRQFIDERIRLVFGEKNLGISARLNQALKMADSEYFARMDHDDISLPMRLEKQVTYLNEHHNVELLSTNVIVYQGDGKVFGKWKIMHGHHDDICRRPWMGFYMAHPTWMGRIEWFRRYRYRSGADGAEDQDLLYRSFRQSCFSTLKEPLLGYKEARTWRKMLRARWIVLYSLGAVAWQQGHYADLARIIPVQTMKILADFLVYVPGLGFLRNQLQALSEGELRAWIDCWDALSARAGRTRQNIRDV